MKVADLKHYIFDRVVLYSEESGDFMDIYKGILSEAPVEILALEIGSIGAKRKGAVDIRVEKKGDGTHDFYNSYL